MKQMDDFKMYLSEKCLQLDSPPKNLPEMEIYIRNAEVRQSLKRGILLAILAILTILAIFTILTIINHIHRRPITHVRNV